MPNVIPTDRGLAVVRTVDDGRWSQPDACFVVKDHPPHGGGSPSASHRWFGGILLLLGLGIVGGCEGCRPWANEVAEEEQTPERLEDFESGELTVLPTDGALAAYGVKPGHWYSAQQRLKSNKVDFDGELQGETADPNRVPYLLDHSPFQLRFRRPASLPRGQAKTFELTYFVPHSAALHRQVWLFSHLQSSYGGGVRQTQPQTTNQLRPHQTYLVVLARYPDQYNYIKTLESVRPPNDSGMGTDPRDYIVVLPPPIAGVPLPAGFGMWTSISYVLWDDFDPAMLTGEQQRSLIDWLHWGGQLIISGPNSLELLRGSFLGSLLPADTGKTQVVAESQLAELNTNWSVPTRTTRVDKSLSVAPDSPIEAIQLRPRPDAQFVPGTSELVVEGRVGRGRIVVSGCALTRREIVNWGSFDNFFNACLLRRPARRYAMTTDAGLVTHWDDAVDAGLERPTAASPSLFSNAKADTDRLANEAMLGDSDRRRPSESLLTSRLRYFSRDAAGLSSSSDAENEASASVDWDGFQADSQAGVAGWNDFSACSRLARELLTKSAGITVPDRAFVLWAIGLYLLVLVPLNWAVFQALGRTEWAWVAVPFLAILGTVAVIRFAQLDVGFVRSRTEISVVETQSRHARAHVTRYIGLYTSLSTDYQLACAANDSLIAPFASGDAGQNADRDGTETVMFARTGRSEASVQLSGLAVSSNSTEMVHVEEMLDLGGAVRWNERPSGLTEVINETPYDLIQVAVLRRRRGKLEFSGLPLLRSGATLRVDLRRVDEDQWWTAWQELEVPASRRSGTLNYEALLRLAADPKRLREGDVRLIAWNEEMLPGVTIEPTSSQQMFWNLWVANLYYGGLPAPQSDRNTPADFRAEDDDDRVD